MEGRIDPNKIINSRGETRDQRDQRIRETAKKLTAVLAETAASYVEVDLIAEETKRLLYVTNQPPAS